MYLALDLESGGVLPDTSLLTVYLDVLDKNLESVDRLYLKLKPNDSKYVITAGGMAVNKIDIIQHDKVAITYSAGGQKLREFLMSNTDKGKSNKLIPIGKSVYSDIEKINQQLLGDKVWGEYVSHCPLEIDSVVRFLKIQNKLPSDMPMALTDLIKYFDVQIADGVAHEADYDTKATIAVLRKLLSL